jgi:hypothetical protein
MKAPLKQPYEPRHAKELTALKKLYEHHAKGLCSGGRVNGRSDGVSSISSWRASGPKRPLHSEYVSTR